MQNLPVKNHLLKINPADFFFDRYDGAKYNKYMITEQDKAIIVEIAHRYDVGGILLFGSSANPNIEANDIDLAVEGIAPEKFFSFYGDLLFGLSKPIDLIDLSSNTKFSRLVCREGIRLYGRSA